MIVSLWSDISLFQFVFRKCGLDLKCRLLNNEGWSLYICLSREKNECLVAPLFTCVFPQSRIQVGIQVVCEEISLELYENGKKIITPISSLYACELRLL